ncbi:E3 ubiquitin-protein ligase WAV3-like [Papaver somniferum]|uniref:E3 ubiquitin-protein ligase WAV3-like n=1 Tax=Papaver somniferum TaxID=3469 RepID=UPI000E6FC562|nr:E3 ubiquitin-protein ligase WAV3-like [Papaver somniferum]
MMTCAICNGAIQVGDGKPMFTAECSHCFHFLCVVSNAKSGNQNCMICQAKWKVSPLQGANYHPSFNGLPNWMISPLEGANFTDPSHKRVRTNMENYWPANLENFGSTVLDPTFGNLLVTEDPLDPQSLFASNSSPYIDIQTYPEISAVQRSIHKENFSVLINLKALVTDIKQDNDDAHMSQSCRAPVDLVTVLDVSGSMRGSKIELLKRAMRFVIENLGPSDRLSIVTFSSYARRLLPLRRMTDSGKQHALLVVNSLATGSGTHILNGLRTGASVIDSRKEKNPFCSIMLLSDGKDTSRETAISTKLTTIKVPVHTFGFGSSHDPVLLHSISQTCKGTFSFVEAERFIQDAFAQCIGGLLSVVLQDVQVHVQCVHPDICLGPLNAGSYSMRLTDMNQTGFIDVGDLYENEERDFLVLLNVPTVGDEGSSLETELVHVGCTYKDPFSKQIKSTAVKKVKIQRPETEEEGFVVVSVEVDREKCRLRATKAMSESRDAAERGDLSGAWSILESCQKELTETTSARAGNQLCAALDSELKEIRSRMQNMQIDESSGRAYVLSGMSSHSGQRATTRGDTSSDSSGFVHVYQTKSMENMVARSHTTG